MSEKVKLVLIASGSGTDAEAIMKAERAGFLPNVEIVGLISTTANVGCIYKAQNYQIPFFVVSHELYRKKKEFNYPIRSTLRKLNAELVFLVGCIHPIPVMDGVDMYNIHPADIRKHGGKGMYGLHTHAHVLREILDLIKRGKKNVNDRFFTHPTVHEVIEEYDKGAPLLAQNVEIPNWIILELVKQNLVALEAASHLQKHVLPYEWEMLPTAVNIAARKILDKKQ